MILIITHKEDYTVDYVVNILNDRKIPYKRLNCEDLSPFSINSNLEFTYEGINNFKSVWFRRTKIPAFKSDEFQKFFQIEYDNFLSSLLSILEGRILSKPDKVYNAENKLLQLKTAKSLGFNIPNTLVTNDRQKLIDFFHANNKRIIVKPFLHAKVDREEELAILFSSLVKEEDILNLENYQLTPIIFQQYIEKKIEYRVTVVNEQVFSAGIYCENTSVVDWRSQEQTFEPIELPYEIQQKCKDVLKSLNIQFGAFDIIQSMDDKFYFIEVNPNGQWVWIETQTGLKISEAIIDYLTNYD